MNDCCTLLILNRLLMPCVTHGRGTTAAERAVLVVAALASIGGGGCPGGWLSIINS